MKIDRSFNDQDMMLRTIQDTMKRENELRGYARLFLINDLLGQLATNLKNKQDVEKWLLIQKENARTMIKLNAKFKDPEIDKL
tara:strand:+ start:232 stop:480 length:249 start_codon:yes stop_codon:yes gene_type:complete